jgi:hypothetical protein
MLLLNYIEQTALVVTFVGSKRIRIEGKVLCKTVLAVGAPVVAQLGTATSFTFRLRSGACYASFIARLWRYEGAHSANEPSEWLKFFCDFIKGVLIPQPNILSLGGSWAV